MQLDVASHKIVIDRVQFSTNKAALEAFHDSILSESWCNRILVYRQKRKKLLRLQIMAKK